jgi:hypothetical protein
VALWLLAGTEAAALESAPILSGHAWREQAHWRVAVSPYTQHFRTSDEHQRVVALALERQRNDGWLAGGSHFTNSFGQPSVNSAPGEKPLLLNGTLSSKRPR